MSPDTDVRVPTLLPQLCQKFTHCRFVIKEIQLPIKRAVRVFAMVSLGHHAIRTVVFEIPSKKDQKEKSPISLDHLTFSFPWFPHYRHADIAIHNARTKVVLVKALLNISQPGLHSESKKVEINLLTPKLSKSGTAQIEMYWVEGYPLQGARLISTGGDENEELGYTSDVDSYTARSARSERQFVLSRLLSNVRSMSDEQLQPPPIESLFPGSRAVTQIAVTIAARLESISSKLGELPKLKAIVGSTPSISSVQLGLNHTVNTADEDKCILLSSQSVTLDYESNLGLDVSIFLRDEVPAESPLAIRNVDISNIVAHRIPVVDIPISPIRELRGFSALYYIRIECLYEGQASYTEGKFWVQPSENPADLEDSTTASPLSPRQGGEFTHRPFIADQLAQKLMMRLTQADNKFTTVELDLLEVAGMKSIDLPVKTLNLLIVIEIGRIRVPLETLILDANINESKRIGYRLQIPYHGEAFALVQMYHRPQEHIANSNTKRLYPYDHPLGISFINLEPCLLNNGNSIRKLYKIRREFPSNVVCGYLKIQATMKGGTRVASEVPHHPSKKYSSLKILGLISKAHSRHPSYIPGCSPIENNKPYTGMVITLEREFNIEVFWADKSVAEELCPTLTVPADGSPIILFITPDDEKNLLKTTKPTSRVSATLSGNDAGVGVVPLIETSPLGQKIKSFPFFVCYSVS